MTKDNKWALLILNFLFLAVALGQLVRFQIFPGASIGLTVVDIVTIAITVGYFIYGLITHNIIRWWKAVWSNKYWRWLLIFLFWATFSLLINFSNLSHQNFLIALSYLGRFYLTYGTAALLWVTGIISKERRSLVIATFLGWSSVLLLLGYLQIIFVGNFYFMAKFGWDPHIGRMLSTFYDPNFLGAYLVMMMSVIAAIFNQSTKKMKWYLAILFILSWAGLYLTFSRSAWLSGALALTLVSWPLSKKISILILVLFIIIALVPGRLSSRFAFGTTILNRNAFSTQVTNSSQENIAEIASEGADPSAAARILSFRKGLDLLEHNWLFGVGYNAYGFALVKSNLATSSILATRSGYSPDSSLLEIIVTTGLIGLVLYLISFFQAFKKLRARFKKDGDRLSLGLAGFMIAWILGSFLNNTLPYVFILLAWLILYIGADEAPD